MLSTDYMIHGGISTGALIIMAILSYCECNKKPELITKYKENFMMLFMCYIALLLAYYWNNKYL